jgi:hypothetical protein
MPTFSEFSPDGQLQIAGKMTTGNASYRVFSYPWTGHPAGPPDVAVRPRSGGATVYVSWNGATQAVAWTVLAGPTSSRLARVGTVRKLGFETAIEVGASGPCFAVQAHDKNGRALATSATVKIRGQ